MEPVPRIRSFVSIFFILPWKQFVDSIIPPELINDEVGFLETSTSVVLDEIDENGVPQRLMFEQLDKALHHHIYIFNLMHRLPQRARNLFRSFAATLLYRSEEDRDVLPPKTRIWVDALIEVHGHIVNTSVRRSQYIFNCIGYCLDQVGASCALLSNNTELAEACNELVACDNVKNNCRMCGRGLLRNNYQYVLNAYGGVILDFTICCNVGTCYFGACEVISFAGDRRLLKNYGTFLNSHHLQAAVNAPHVDMINDNVMIGMVNEVILQNPNL